ncbi:Carbohydrate-selective porin, OprB family [Aeoliella mucimassa]|uniref:Carbohydrate-selective porin, OprB family n=2 Tax=Aeoliella mucimassa TaxID=2527972 RepID=A0A518AN28_9BACT|nr:Carbohydrate-selective porin, OprB family [Aeoliella mucimassa]
MRTSVAVIFQSLMIATAIIGVANGQGVFNDGCYCAETLTGDWCGNRTCLAENGITFDMDVAHFYHGVTSGGLERHFTYAGHGDYVTNVDFGKLGVQEGLFLKVRAEHRFGETINPSTGAVLPATVLADLPVADSEDLMLTNVLFTQFLNERTAVFFGKLDTLDGDANAFASGRGKTQFMNSGFVVNPIALRTVPYSSLGCGFLIMGEGGEPLFNYTIINPRDTANRAGFDELFADGVAMSAELRLPSTFWGKPGHHLFGGTWSSRDYVALDQDPRVIFPEVAINETQGSWSLYYNFDQYLYTDRCDPSKGWGLFGRAGIADDKANPIAYFLSLGIGGNNPYCGHRNDTFGLGWFMSGTSDQISPFLEIPLGPIGDGYGVEMFYNCEVTKWLNISPDVQVLMPARQEVDPALVIGVRAVMQL